MLFNSFQFLAFFPVVLIGYFVIPNKIKYIWMLIASYYFYMCWNPSYALLILTVTGVTYICGMVIDKSRKYTTRRFVLILGILFPVGILLYFKYFTFLMQNVNRILNLINQKEINLWMDVLLPVGISFYTFQSISYIVDIYRGNLTAEKNFLKYALYIAFFPQLVAGPIERPGSLLKQISDIPKMKLWDYDRITNGMVFMLYGYFLKMVLADRLALIVDVIFMNYNELCWTSLVLGAVSFSIQIYCDFASYSAIAIGAAQIMGIVLMENFNGPYLAVSLKDFWSRWHISLSTWLRDYLYIPLGGNRCTGYKRDINLMITFLVSGFWHGAAWKYIIWGSMHGFFRIVETETKQLRKRIRRKIGMREKCISYKLLRVTEVFLIVTLTWIFFRANSIWDALHYIKRIVWLSEGGVWRQFIEMENLEIYIVLLAIAILFLCDLAKELTGERMDVLLNKQNLYFKWGVLLVEIIMILVFGVYGVNVELEPFIYFQF